MKQKSLVDPPSPFAPRAEWERFLAEMKRLDQSDPAVIYGLSEAKKILGAD